ncbi:MAG: Hsp20 family protein [Bacteroidia bacterium]|nr:Hsp20 family protein [Bacteroidia bacterium]
MSVVKFHHLPAVRFGHFFDDFITRDLARFAGAESYHSEPKVNVRDYEDHFRIEVAAPGLSREDFRLSIHENVLKISAGIENNQAENQGRYTRKEFGFEKFERSFTLPKTINQENITAKYVNGILNITLPKLPEATPRPSREIEISPA